MELENNSSKMEMYMKVNIPTISRTDQENIYGKAKTLFIKANLKMVLEMVKGYGNVIINPMKDII
jgi:hypothetical protein